MSSSLLTGGVGPPSGHSVLDFPVKCRYMDLIFVLLVTLTIMLPLSMAGALSSMSLGSNPRRKSIGSAKDIETEIEFADAIGFSLVKGGCCAFSHVPARFAGDGDVALLAFREDS